MNVERDDTALRGDESAAVWQPPASSPASVPPGSGGAVPGSRLCAPFPWFGGKSRVANVVWQRFGDVPNYVEPFAGSLAVLLARPHAPGTETVNDADCYLANFWRAVSADPEAVATFATWPVNEADLHARHRWLVGQAYFRERMKSEPDYYNAKLAGWWVWGLCSWIGGGWCVERGDGRTSKQLPHLGTVGMGVHRRLPHLGTVGMGVHRRLPHLGTVGMGVHRRLPHLGDAGRGVHRRLPHLGDAGRGDIVAWMRALADRLARVRVACGDWSRVLGPSVTEKHGITGVFLDPPYSSDEHDVRYSAAAAHDAEPAAEARAWAIANGDSPLLRIALCGYDGEHEMPDSWSVVAWKARGGYGSRNAENANPHRERIWFSPACVTPTDELPLFREESV